MPHVFDAAKRHLLDDSNRLKWHEPYSTLRMMGLREGMVMADLGCGTGFFTLPASETVGPMGTVYAVDVQEGMLKELEKRVREKSIRNVKMLLADIIDAKLEDDSIDLVFIANTFHEVEQKDGIIKKAWSILKPQGVIAIVEWVKRRTQEGPPMEDRLSEDEVVHYLRRNGFHDCKVMRVGPYHYAVVGRKA